MVIRRVRIENFKRFERLSVDVRPFDCLVGPNNGGKTTLLQALALFDFCVHHCVSTKNGGTELKRRTIAPEEFYVLPVSSPVDLWTDRKTQGGGRHRIIRIAVMFDQGREVTAAVDLNYNRFSVSIECEDKSEHWLQRLRQVRMSYLPVFSMFLPQEERRTPAVIADELARGRVNSVIRNLLLDLKENGRDAELVKVLQRVFPSLVEMSIEFDEASDRYITVSYQERSRPKEFDVFSGGSGFQQFIYLFGFILLRQPTVILLDEPDVHLHGSLQVALLSELRELVESGKQVLFATHSRELIARMSPENILTLETDGPRRLSVAFDIYDALDRLGSVDPTQLPVIQAYRRVLVVEDQKDKDILFVLCAKSLGSSVWQQVERRLAVCYARGNPWKQDMARLREQLQQMNTISGQALEMFVIGDRDYYPDVDGLRQSLPTSHLHWHIWDRVEIENYLLSVDAILRRVRGEPSAQRTLAEEALRQEFDQLMESSHDAANDQLVQGFQEFCRRTGKHWDAVTLSKMAREYLQKHWSAERVALCDAKGIVLPGIKRWLQGQGQGQFSDKGLSDMLGPEDLPEELHTLARRLAEFAGVPVLDANRGEP